MQPRFDTANKNRDDMNKSKSLVIGAAVAGIGISVVLWWQSSKCTGTSGREVVTAVIPAYNKRQVGTGALTATSLNKPTALAPAQIQQIITNASWDEATLTSCWSQIGPFEEMTLSKKQAITKLTNAAHNARLPAPSNGEELLKSVYELLLTNQDEGFVHLILSGVTNEAYADLLIWGFTNFHIQASQIADLHKIERDVLMSKSQCSFLSLGNIGTPAVMDRLNKLLRQLQNEGHGIYEPGAVINPANYPVEAREWLLNYPEPLVRYGMLDEWLHSGRPETPELVDAFCKRLTAFPDDFYLWRGDPDVAASKRDIIEEVKRARASYVRRYKRWMADGQKENFNSGNYYDELWDAYKKKRGLP